MPKSQLIVCSIFLTLLIFIVFIYLINLELESQTDYGGGSLDLDSELSPSYSPYHYQILQFNSIFVAGPIILGVISLVFLIPNIILRIKKIPTRKYMLIITAGILIFFGSSWIHSGLLAVTPESFEQQPDYRILLVSALIQIGIGSVPFILGIIVLKKAKLRIRKD